MNIHKLQIEGFKSIGKIELIAPNPFSVFVGPNAAGKSNIFEALEFFEMCDKMAVDVVIKKFGNINDLVSKNLHKENIQFYFDISLTSINPLLKIPLKFDGETLLGYSFNDWRKEAFEGFRNDLPPRSSRFIDDIEY